MRQGVVAAVAAVAGAALGYAYSRLQSAPITLSKSSKKSLIDLEQDLLERGTARGESSLAQRAAAKVVTEGPHQGKPYVFRLVLTGGPCGGKSSSLAHFTEKLTQLGFEVFSAPEVPTIMMNGGCKFPGTSDDHKLMEFESALLQLQIQTERTFLQVAASTRKPAVVVMDRGVNDIKAYMRPEQWMELIQSHNLTEEYIDSRYDLILHLVTAADGAEKYYTTANNAIRTETAEHARQLDGMIQGAYALQKANGKFARIDNSTDFNGKLSRATEAVMRMLEGKIQA